MAVGRINISRTGKFRPPKICVEIGKLGIWANASSIAGKLPFQHADAFELKRADYIPILHALKSGKADIMDPDSFKLREVMNSGKEMIYHHETVIDRHNWNLLLHQSSGGKDALTILKELGVNFASFHLGGSNYKYFYPRHSKGDFEKYNLVSKPDIKLFTKRFMQIFEQRYNFIKRKFSGEIAFENCACEPERSATQFVYEPKVINEVFGSFNDIHLLLDIGHSFATSYRLGIKVEDYVSRLPLKKIKEIHIHHSFEGRDAHEPPTRQEFELLGYVIGKGARPDYITVEYYRDDDKLFNSMIKLKKALKNIK